MASDKSEAWQVPLVSLGNTLSEARELAAVLEETLGVRVDYGNFIQRSATTSHLRVHTFKDRLLNGVPTPIDDRSINWSLLCGVVSTESLKDTEPDAAAHAGHLQLEVNSGGRVFFCFFAPASTGEPEGVAVLKFGPNRLLMQAEQFANELTRHLDICAPDCRIVRQAGPSSEEWKALSEACLRLGASCGSGGSSGSAAELASELAQMPVALLMEYCPGRPLLECEEAFLPPETGSGTFEELGRLFLLDAVLGNADRLPCGELCWRGNPNNVLFGRAGSRCASHIVAIDSCVQRRPPAARLCAEDAGVDRLAQLLLTDQDFTLELLRSSVLAHSPPALAALAAAPETTANAFRRGFRECLRLVERIKGLLEMMHSKMDEWSVEFIKDVKELRPELLIPNPSPPGACAGGNGGSSSSRLVAHYGGLNIRVSNAQGGSLGCCGIGGGRNRWGSAGSGAVNGSASGNSSGVGSPAWPRPSPSPYLARCISRSRNSSLGGTGSSSELPDGLVQAPSSAMRGRSSLAAVAAARSALGHNANAAAVAGTGQPPAVPSECVGTEDGSGIHGPRVVPTFQAVGAAGLRDRATAPDEGRGSGGGGPGTVNSSDSVSPGGMRSPRNPLFRGPSASGHVQKRSQYRTRARGDWTTATRTRSSAGGQPLQQQQQHIPSPSHSCQPLLHQQCLRCMSPEVAAAVTEMPEWLACSPYLVSGPGGEGGNNGALVTMACRWRSLTPPDRRCPSVCISSSFSSVCGANTSSSSSSDTSGGRPTQAAMLVTMPQSCLAAAAAGATAAPLSVKSVLQCGARISSPATADDSCDTVPQAATSRRATDIGVAGVGGQAPAVQGPLPDRAAAPAPAPWRLQVAINSGLPTGNSPAQAVLRAGSVVGSGSIWGAGPAAGADGGGCTTPRLRHSLSFGVIRSPRHSFRRSVSPRKNLSPATPKFRSPLLEPLLAALPPVVGDGDDANTSVATAAAGYMLLNPTPPLSSLSRAQGGAYFSEGGAAIARSRPGDERVNGATVLSSLSLAAGPPCGPSTKPPLPRAGSLRTTNGTSCPGSVHAVPFGTAQTTDIVLSAGTLIIGSNPPFLLPSGRAAAVPSAAGAGAGDVGDGGSPGSAGSSPLGHFFKKQPEDHEDRNHPQRLPGGAEGRSLPASRLGQAYTPPQKAEGGPTEPTTRVFFNTGAAAAAGLTTPLTTPRSLSLASAAVSGLHAAGTSTPPTAPSAAVKMMAMSPRSRTPPSTITTPCTPNAVTIAAGSSAGRSDRVAGAGRTAGANSTTTATDSPASAASARSTAVIAMSSRRNSSGGGRGRAAIRSGGGSPSRVPYGAGRGTAVGMARAVMIRPSPSPRGNPYDQFKSDVSLTLALKSITSEARKDDLLSNRVQCWKELFRRRGEELKAAVGEWQHRHQLDKVLTTGFLDGTHPIVDTYELKVRLDHMLRRLQVLQEAAGAEKPSCVLPAPGIGGGAGALFLGGAVAADSHHILRHLGISHIVNATEELLLPEPSAGFVVLRVPLRDVDDEDIATHFAAVSEFIKSCHESGGSVLVHCSEGKSRSVTLVLAYLMRVRSWRLKTAFDHVKSHRPVACPNAGFMAKLLSYERELYGSSSYIPQQLKKAKPDPVVCLQCGAAVGISSASLGVHMRRVHPKVAAAAAAGGPVAAGPLPQGHKSSTACREGGATVAAAAKRADSAAAAPP